MFSCEIILLYSTTFKITVHVYFEMIDKISHFEFSLSGPPICEVVCLNSRVSQQITALLDRSSQTYFYKLLCSSPLSVELCFTVRSFWMYTCKFWGLFLFCIYLYCIIFCSVMTELIWNVLWSRWFLIFSYFLSVFESLHVDRFEEYGYTLIAPRSVS